MVAATLSRDTVVVALSVSGRVPELLELPAREALRREADRDHRAGVAAREAGRPPDPGRRVRNRFHLQAVDIALRDDDGDRRARHRSRIAARRCGPRIAASHQARARCASRRRRPSTGRRLTMHSHPEAADTLIVGAQLYDGTGAPPVARDVAIRNGLIAAIGNLSNWLAENVVDANGRALAPGFVDVHARRHARDPRTGDDPEDLAGRDDRDRRQLRDQRVAGDARGRSARSDEPARRARCVPVPDLRRLRRGRERRASGCERRGARRPHGAAQQPDGPPRPRGDRRRDRRHARAARGGARERRTRPVVRSRVRLRVRRPKR